MLCVDMQIAKMIHKPNNDEFTWSVDAATEQMIMDTMRAHQPGWIVLELLQWKWADRPSTNTRCICTLNSQAYGLK